MMRKNKSVMTMCSHGHQLHASSISVMLSHISKSCKVLGIKRKKKSRTVIMYSTTHAGKVQIPHYWEHLWNVFQQKELLGSPTLFRALAADHTVCCLKSSYSITNTTPPSSAVEQLMQMARFCQWLSDIPMERQLSLRAESHWKWKWKATSQQSLFSFP